MTGQSHNCDNPSCNKVIELTLFGEHSFIFGGHESPSGRKEFFCSVACMDERRGQKSAGQLEPELEQP